MFTTMIRKVVGSKNDREVKRLYRIVQRINALEPDMEALSDEDIRGKTEVFRERLKNGETLDQLLPEAFALVREASRRTLGLRHFDVQMVGGIVLHSGKISEMKTGEGKTLVATLATYLNALPGKGVHIVTVNDYLARRDSDWMRPLYEALGMKVGVVAAQQDPNEKREAYQADVTYGTNNEFGFDYLRDNMAFSLEDKYQRGHAFGIVDEVDSILIDEARTPLIISGAAEDSSERYIQINKLIPKLEPGREPNEGEEGVEGDFLLDEKNRSIELTEEGHQKVERLLQEAGLLPEDESLYAPQNLLLFHHITAGLKAHHLFNRNVDYIIQEGQVVIVDEHTGRTMPGRRWSDGLHQAVEAKEGLQVQKENQTLASTTFQNYFRLYEKLSGMTGTADTEAFELRQIYGLDVVVIPTNKPIARVDYNDLIYLTEGEKFNAVIDDVKAEREKGRPILVGTASVEASERISEALEKAKIPHNVLNAKQHDREADIIAQAGQPGAVTIATNMAGRGTDIVLGGNWENELKHLDNPDESKLEHAKADWQERHDAVIAAGGLHIIGTERHESRRIDNQLRGRAGRQGDPGSSRFFLSMEDSLMRIFMPERMKGIMQSLGMKDGEAIEAKMVTNAIEKAQRKVENRNFDIRKQLLEYDDVANDQRQVVYQQRDELMAADSIEDVIENIRRDIVDAEISEHLPPQSLPEQWDVSGLEKGIEKEFGVKLPIQQWLDEDDHLHEEALRERIQQAVVDRYKEKEQVAGPEALRKFEKQVMLQVLDQHWKEHLYNMDHLRQGIHLRGYAQKNPKQEYKRESFELFQSMLEQVKADTIRILSHVQVRTPEEAAEEERKRREAAMARMRFQHEQASAMAEAEGKAEAQPGQSAGGNANAGGQPQQPQVRQGQKVGRNEPCPCGSGKKYKHCHGKLS
ncbi:preprotein translocase subunit SecA [Saccharospirillum salsuginis]|uniref:Protein translocase subunit SecA n=1 Tax=Saccharospirillum salsuginis TaxID=418750 RepID=A0A918KPD2_9GAMM|nr:preprotein translocase subunit SecA [Saccharospirillum salsuginis]GGX69384.1 protein translocase subunit SecA [Saccharospirillum salsuginis]